MSQIFLKLINLTINASWLILAVIVARLLLKKAPKWVSCLLWGLVAIRLLCPISIESALSLLPSGKVIPGDIEMMQAPHIDSGVKFINNTVNPVMERSLSPAVVSSVNPMQVVVYAGSLIWIAGMAAMLIYALISFLMLKRKVRASIALDDRVRECDEVRSPFILGIISPVIYVPSGMSSDTLDMVLAHEEAHLKRHDHWWKPLGFILLAVYWFNPLCWAAYILLCRDIEAACDEKVIRDKDRDYVASYSKALLDCSVQRRVIAACPVAFGETGVKGRIKSVLNYKKPAFWVIAVALIACIVVAVCFMTDPKGGEPELTEENVGLQELAGAEESVGVQEQKNTETTDIIEGQRIYYYSGNKDEGKDLINFSITLNGDGTYTWYETPFSSFIGMGTYSINKGYLYMTDDEEMTGIARTNIFRMEGDRLYYVSEGSSNFAYVKLEDGEEFVLGRKSLDLTEEELSRSMDFAPDDIHDIVCANMRIARDNSLPEPGIEAETFYLHCEDPEILRMLEEMLAGATIEKGQSNCPFNTPLYLTRSDGTIGTIYPATDSCSMYLSGGECYKYAEGTNEEFWKLIKEFDVDYVETNAEDAGDLVYRNYGDNAVHAETGSIINISIKNDLNYLDSVYVGNCRTGEEVKLPVLRTVSYKVEESGDYYAYAVSVEGSFIDLSDSISIMHPNGANLNEGMELN